MEQLAGLPSQAAVDLLIADRSRWIADITSVGNGLAHSGTHKGPTTDLFELARTTAFLVYLIIMQRLELDRSLQLKAVQNNGYLSIKRAEQAMLTGGNDGSAIDGD